MKKLLAIMVTIGVLLVGCSKHRTVSVITAPINFETTTETPLIMVSDTPTVVPETETYTFTQTSTSTTNVGIPTSTFTNTIETLTVISTETSTSVPSFTMTYTSTNTNTFTSTYTNTNIIVNTPTSTPTGFHNIPVSYYPSYNPPTNTDGIARHKLISFNGYLISIGGVSRYNPPYVYPTTRMYRTTDGINWVSDGFTYKYPDGSTCPGKWTQRSSVSSVEFNGQIFVIGGSNSDETGINQVWSTINGVDWVLQTQNAFSTGGIKKPVAVVYNNEILVFDYVPGEVVQIWHSTDGINYYKNVNDVMPIGDTITFKDAVVNNGKLYLVGCNWNTQGRIYRTTDLINWESFSNQTILCLNNAIAVAGETGFGPTVVSYSNKIVINGGFVLTDNGSTITETNLYGIDSRNTYASSTVWNGYIWICGGFITNNQTNAIINKIYF